MAGRSNNVSSGFLPKTITRHQAKDTGMAMVLICLLLGLIGDKSLFIGLAVGLLLINMIRPSIYRPLARLWIGFSSLLGTVVSKILLSILFFVLVTPVGLVRRTLGADSLQLKKWKKSHASVFKERNHVYRADDIKNPF